MNVRKQSHQLFQMDQLQREFDINQFLAVTEHLLNAMSLNFNLNIKELYNQIKQQNGRVIGRDILKLLHLLKEENAVQKQLDEQIQFYRSTIQQFVSKGKSSLTNGQFFVTFILNNPRKGIVTDEIQDKISQYKIISMQKLLGLIQFIERTRNQSKTLKSDASNILLTSYHKESQLAALNRDQLYQIEQLKKIILQNCADQNKNSQSMLLLEKIKKNLLDNLEYIQKLEQSHRSFGSKQQKFGEQLSRLQQVINQKQYQISKLYQKNQGYQNQIQIFEQKCRQDFSETIQKLGQDNNRLLGQRNEALKFYEQMTKQLQWFKVNYQDIFAKYQQHIQKEAEIQLNSETESQVKPKFEYILQNQAKQNYQCLTKLRLQNIELKHRISQLQAQAEARALTSGHQTDRTFKNLTLDQKAFTPIISNHEQAKQTFLQLLRKKSYMGDIEGQLSKSLFQQRSNSIRLIRTVTNEFFRQTSKMQQNEIKQQQYLKLSPKNQNLSETTQKLYEFDFLGILNSPILSKITNLLQNSSSFVPSRKLFTSVVSVIKSTSINKKQKLAFVMSSNKLLFYSIKNMQKKFSLKIQNLKQVCFCENIRDLIVIRTKQNSINFNNNLTNQLVLSINNRDQLLKYFAKNGFLNRQSQYKVTFQDEQKIYVKQKQKNLNLSCFLIMNNLVQNSVNDGENIFEVKIHYPIAIFHIACKSVIIINPVGILVFEAGKNCIFQAFQQKQKLKFILPFNKNMQIIDLSQQNKIKLVYPVIQKSYVIQLSSFGEAKLVKQKIKFQKQKIAENRKKQSDQYLTTFSNLRKMRSVQQQQSTIFTL